MQALVSRETPPVGTAVVSVTKIQAGEGAFNVIPDDATFGGTIRSLEHDHIVYLKRRFAEVRLRGRGGAARLPRLPVCNSAGRMRAGGEQDRCVLGPDDSRMFS